MNRIGLLLVVLFPTLASADNPPLSRIGFGSCASQEKPQPIWEAVLAQNPELFIMLGANIYADTDNPEIMKKKYDQLAAVPGFQRLCKACPILAVWDDHDFAASDSGNENRNKDAAQRLFLDFFKEPKDSLRRQRPGLHTSAVFGPPGQRVQVVLLDTRYHRSPLKRKGSEYVPDNDPALTFLGEAQWKWLEEQLKIPAEIRLIGSSIQVVADDHPFEKWANFPHERERLYKLLRDSKATGVIVLSGGRRLAELSQTDANLGYPLYDLTSSGLNMGAQRWRGMEKNSRRVATMTHGDNFGAVLIDWSKPDPQIRLQIRNVDGEVTIQQKLELSLLKPGAIKAVATAPEKPDKPLPAGVLTPIEAAQRVGEKVTIEFAVKGTGQTRDRSRVFLNSADFRDKDNFTVVFEMKKLEEALKQAGIMDPREHYKDKTVRVTGTVAIFRDSPQIVVDDLKLVEIVN